MVNYRIIKQKKNNYLYISREFLIKNFKTNNQRKKKNMSFAAPPPIKIARTGPSLLKAIKESPVSYNLKFFDTPASADFINWRTFIYHTAGAAQTCNLLFAPQLGTDLDKRIGRRTTLLRIKIKGKIDSANTIGGFVTKDYKPNLCRLIFFVDKQANGAKPNVADLLYNVNDPNGATATQDLNTYPIHSYCLTNINNTERFKILSDSVYLIGATTVSTANGWAVGEGTQSYFINKTIDAQNTDTVFNAGNTKTITDIATGAVYMLCLGLYGTATADPTLTCNVRCEYIDA